MMHRLYVSGKTLFGVLIGQGRIMNLRGSFVSAFVLVFGFTTVPLGSAEIRHVSEYDISLGILPIAKASFASEFNSSDYKITGTFKSAGIVNIISRISAETSVSGRMQADKLQADRYNLVYSAGRRTRLRRRIPQRQRHRDDCQTRADPQSGNLDPRNRQGPARGPRPVERPLVPRRRQGLPQPAADL